MKVMNRSLMVALLMLTADGVTGAGSILKLADQNGDERLSLQEFKKYKAAIMKKQGWSDPYHEIKKMFYDQDLNTDGYLSRSELALPYSAISCRIDEAFKSHGERMTQQEYLRCNRRLLLEQGRAGWLCEIEAAFRTRDQNHDGMLSVNEFTSISADAEARFMQADQDQDKQLDRKEFKVYATDRARRIAWNGHVDPDGRLEIIFDNGDHNGDGYLSRAELYPAPKEKTRNFRRADRNNDQFISPDEFKSIRDRRKNISRWRFMIADECREKFTAYDLNTDGYLTREEYERGQALALRRSLPGSSAGR